MSKMDNIPKIKKDEDFEIFQYKKIMMNMVYSNEHFVEYCEYYISDNYIKIDNNSFILWKEETKEWFEGDRNDFRIIVRYYLITELYDYIKDTILEDEKKKIFKFLNNKLDKLINLIPKSKRDKIELLRQFNKQKNVLPFKNGKIFDMKTKCIRNNNKNDLFFFKLEYDENTLELNKDDEVEKLFFSWFGDNETISKFINHIYRCLGCNMSRLLVILSGNTKNGKSTLITMLEDIFNPLIGGLSEKIFMSSNGFESSITSHLVNLDKYRIGIFNEGQGCLNQELIKRITGGDSFTVRDLFKSEYSTRATASLIMTCNTSPSMKDNDAMKGRLRAYNFPNSFIKNDEFEENLTKMYPYIFSYILRKGQLDLDEIETKNMILTRENIELYSDIVQQYINSEDDYIIYNDKKEDIKNYKFKANEFYTNFKNWLRHNSLDTKISKIKTLEILDKKGIEEKKDKDGRWRYGLLLKINNEIN